MDDQIQCQECQNCIFFQAKIDAIGACDNPKAMAGQLQHTVTKMHWCPAWAGEQYDKVTTLETASLRRR